MFYKIWGNGIWYVNCTFFLPKSYFDLVAGRRNPEQEGLRFSACTHVTRGHPCPRLLPSEGTAHRLRCSSLLSSEAGWMPSQHSTSVNFQQSMALERKPIWYPWNVLHTFITPCSKYGVWASILRSMFVQWCLTGQFHSCSVLKICKTFFFHWYFIFFLSSLSFVFRFYVCGKTHVLQNLRTKLVEEMEFQLSYAIILDIYSEVQLLVHMVILSFVLFSKQLLL